MAGNRNLSDAQIDAAAGALVNWRWLIPDGNLRTPAWQVHPDLRGTFREDRARLQARNIERRQAMNARGEFR